MIKKFLSTAFFIAIIFATSLSTFGYDLSEPCGLSEQELAGKLKYELVQYAEDFLDAENEHGVNACFLAAVASLESGHGRYCFRPNNIFGWSGKSFDSVPDCIDYVAEKLKKNYIDPNGKYYRGGTIADIGKIYCPGNEDWVRLVSSIFEKLSEKPKENKKINDFGGELCIIPMTRFPISIDMKKN